jgi:hypothetical protein
MEGVYILAFSLTWAMTEFETHTHEVINSIAAELGTDWELEVPRYHQRDLPGGNTIRVLIIYKPSIKHSLCIYPNAQIIDGRIVVRFLSQTGVFETGTFDDWVSYKQRLRELYKSKLCKAFQLS